MSKVNRVDFVQKQLIKFGKDVEQFVIEETQLAGRTIETDAKRLAPVNKAANIIGGSLKQQITYKPSNGGLGARIFANAPYSAYVEFGTGGLVNVPSELKELAILFKGKGVKQINIRPQPFLYPAFTLNRQKYIASLQKKLQILTTNVNKSR
jgi:HK97 gp10 family phage protein